MKDDRYSPCPWPNARITATDPGDDCILKNFQNFNSIIYNIKFAEDLQTELEARYHCNIILARRLNRCLLFIKFFFCTVLYMPFERNIIQEYLNYKKKIRYFLNPLKKI